MVRLFFLALIFTSLSQGQAAVPPAYYGREFSSTNATGPELKENLFRILNGYHQRIENDFDRIVPGCEESQRCYRHTAIGYTNARKFLFGDFYLVRQGNDYGVKDLYCQRVALAAEFPGAKPGPNVVPDPNVMNAEHTWPQSKFSRLFPQDDQKSDLHHLYPTDSQMNSKRGNEEFGNVGVDSEQLKCSVSRLGNPKSGVKAIVFEPPAGHRGNVARAVFYFSTRYKMQVSPLQEATLKEWNRADPVDEEEKARNERIFDLQKNRNPFVDFPELADRISDF